MSLAGLVFSHRGGSRAANSALYGNRGSFPRRIRRWKYLTRRFNNFSHSIIAAQRIVVEEHQPPDFRSLCQSCCFQPCSVPPARVLRIFIRRVLRVRDEQIGVPGAIEQGSIALRVAVLEIGCINNAVPSVLNPEASASLRMMQRKRHDMKWSNLERVVPLNGPIVFGRRGGIEGPRKEWLRHLGCEMGVHPLHRSVGVKPDYSLPEERREIGKALNVIPMKMREHDVFADRGCSELIDDLVAELPDAAARIEHNSPSLCFDLHARSFPAEVQIRAFGRRNTAAYSPEGHFHGVLTRTVNIANSSWTEQPNRVFDSESA